MKNARTRMSVGKTDFERDLLRSWESEQPSDNARQQALALVGGGAALGNAAASTTKAAEGAAKAAKIATTTSLPPKAATVGFGVAGKWVLASAILTTVVGASIVRSNAVRETSRGASPTATSVQQNTPVAGTTRIPSRLDAPIASATQLAPTEISSSKPAPKTIAPPVDSVSTAAIGAIDPVASAEGATTTEHERSSLALGEEVAELDRARAASASGDYASALASLDAYDARFPQGALTQESAALRIEALVGSGDTKSGARLAEQFLAANPSSPHAARIRQLLQR